MARYRKIDLKMWADAKFRQLSKPQPNAQFLWLYLLTGPFTTIIPGVIIAGPAAMAEALGWSLRLFKQAFDEIIALDMVHVDFEARLIWVPNAVKFNPPASVKVVVGWRKVWDEIPECPLKEMIYKTLSAFLKDKGDAFTKAFSIENDQRTVEPMFIQDQELENRRLMKTRIRSQQ